MNLGDLFKKIATHGSKTKDGKPLRFYDPGTDEGGPHAGLPIQVREHGRYFQAGAVHFFEQLEDAKGWDSFNLSTSGESYFRSESHHWLALRFEAWRERPNERHRMAHASFRIDVQTPWMQAADLHELGKSAGRAFFECIAADFVERPKQG